MLAAFGDSDLTIGQQAAVEKLDEFLADPRARCFLLKGYAGTGKTFLLKGLACYFTGMRRIFSLLAPTGRAARVLQKRTGFPAHTVHRAIYALDRLVEHDHADDAFSYYYGLREVGNDETDQVYIVDESSMVSDKESEGEFIRFGSGRLLSDLVQFARLDNPRLKSKLIFVGDPAQLPPVSDGNHSPALDAGYLLEHFKLKAKEYELTDVVRHVADGGIARHATRIRDDLRANRFNRLAIESNERDVRAVSIQDLPGVCLEQDKACARADTICITYTNRTALTYNMILRGAIYGQDGSMPPQPGDRLLVVCNNGRYGLFNGDLVEAAEVDAQVESRMIRDVPLVFRKVVIANINDAGERMTQQCMILENLLLSGERDVTREEQQALYIDFKIRHKDLKPNTEMFRMALQEDPYFNALKVKYGYAVTCHKAQGGEWERAVVVFEKYQGWDNPAWFRWCYTAITRAKNELFTMNAPHWSAFSELALALPGTGAALLSENCEQGVALQTLVPGVLEGRGLSGSQEFGRSNEDGTLVSDVNAGKENLASDAEPFMQAKLDGYKRLLSEKGIELVRMDNKPASWYMRLFVKKGMQTACLQVYYTKRQKFKAPQWIRQPGDSEDLLKMAEELFVSACPVWTVAVTGIPAIGKDAATLVFPDDRPYLSELCEFLRDRLEPDGMIVASVEHLPYAERYFFMRGPEKAVIDFFYNGKGRFQTPQVKGSLGNSPGLAAAVMSGLGDGVKDEG